MTGVYMPCIHCGSNAVEIVSPPPLVDPETGMLTVEMVWLCGCDQTDVGPELCDACCDALNRGTHDFDWCRCACHP